MSKTQPGYERQDAPALVIVIGLATILILLAIGLGVAGLALRGLEGGKPLGPPHGPTTASSIPLETKPGATLAVVRARGEAKLTHGPVPIDEAMAQIAQHGWADPDTGEGKP